MLSANEFQMVKIGGTRKAERKKNTPSKNPKILSGKRKGTYGKLVTIEKIKWTVYYIIIFLVVFK